MPLYSLYIPKHSGTLSLLPRVIGDFLTVNTNRNKQFELVISPGYLGEGREFISKVKNILTRHVSSLTVYRGMTSAQRHQNSTHDLQMALRVGVFPTPAEDDHRKMIFFRYGNNTEAVLVGSSNFSNATYFKPGKGEADLFLFYDETFKNDSHNNILRSQAGSDSNSQDNGNSLPRERRPRRNASRDDMENDTPQENTERNPEGYRYCVLSESITMNFEPQRYLNDIYTEFTGGRLTNNA